MMDEINPEIYMADNSTEETEESQEKKGFRMQQRQRENKQTCGTGASVESYSQFHFLFRAMTNLEICVHRRK